MTGSMVCPRCNGRLVRERTTEPEGIVTTTRCTLCGDTSRDTIVERRSTRRYAIELPVGLVFAGHRLDAKGLNISVSGMSLWFPGPKIERGQVVYLKVPTPDVVLRLTGRVAWSRAAKGLPDGEMGTEAGIAFDAHRMSAGSLAALESLIARQDSSDA